LRGKPAAFRVIDTHAGAGLYDLTGEQATRGVLAAGIRSSWLRKFRKRLQLCFPYLEVVRALNEHDRLRVPDHRARRWLRQDRLIACELEAKAAALSRNLSGDPIKTLTVDGWTALKARAIEERRGGAGGPTIRSRQRFLALPAAWRPPP
jgi:23S rRNA (adenine2030-N6)-methyltransferase